MLEITNPVQTVLVTCRHRVTSRFSETEKEKDNIIPIDWHMACSFKPMMYAISVSKKRYSYKLISESRCFVVNFIPCTLKDAVIFCGRHSGEHLDKFKETGLTMEEAESVDCCRLKEAIGYLECEVVQEIETGDHVLFIANIVGKSKKIDEKRLFHQVHDEFTTTND